MFDLRWVKEAQEKYDELELRAEESKDRRKKSGKAKATKDEGLFKQVCRTIQNLRADPRHPGLHTHKYHGFPHPWDKNKGVFEAYVQNNTPGAYRVFWCYGPGKSDLTIIAITPHP